MNPVIVLDRVSRWYGQVIGINDVTVSLPQGVTGLLGPNGAGKSTLLKLLTGQIKPSAGTASGVHPVPLGFGRVYVKLSGPFRYESWINGLRDGRSLQG